MKRKPVRTAAQDMRPEYDFSGAVRGKYYRRYHDTSNVVVIDPDVHERFRNAAAVNKALRALIRAAGEDRGRRKRPTRTRTR
jgi:hypothetical protein